MLTQPFNDASWTLRLKDEKKKKKPLWKIRTRPFEFLELTNHGRKEMRRMKPLHETVLEPIDLTHPDLDLTHPDLDLTADAAPMSEAHGAPMAEADTVPLVMAASAPAAEADAAPAAETDAAEAEETRAAGQNDDAVEPMNCEDDGYELGPTMKPVTAPTATRRVQDPMRDLEPQPPPPPPPQPPLPPPRHRKTEVPAAAG